MFCSGSRVYCIHLPNAERRAAIERQFLLAGISDVSYVHATPPPSGFAISNMRRAPAAEFGASLSHIKAVVQAISDGAESALFFEDDIVFRKAWQPGEWLFPADWDVIYYGGHPREPVKMVSANVAKVGRFSFAEAYALNGKALRKFFDFWCDRIGKPNAMYDFILGEFAAANNAYAVYPPMTEQPPGFSQISGKHDDKRELVARGWAANRVA